MTTVQLVTRTSARATIGEAWLLEWLMLDVNGLPTSIETPTATVTKPDGSPVVLTPTLTPHLSWTASYIAANAGRHLVHIVSLADAVDAALFVDMVLTESGMPTANDAIEYLGARGGGWTTAQITKVYNAERAAQRTRCGELAVYPDDLREALLRRVARNIAMRQLPLAVSLGDQEAGPIAIGGSDPEVRRLERPFWRLSVG